MKKLILLTLFAVLTVIGCKTEKKEAENISVETAKAEQKKTVGIMTAVQAESELMFNNAIKRAGGVNKFDHGRLPATPETQRIVRSQSDMLYSHGVFDATEGLKVIMPKQITGYHTVHLFDANHAQVAVIYPEETLEVTPEMISTTDKHIYAMMRTSTDRGIENANQAQDQVQVIAMSNTPYIGPGYDEKQLTQAKRVLAGAVPAGLVKARTAYVDELIPNTVMLKSATDIDKYHYLMCSLLGWGLMPNADAYYPQIQLKDGECTEVHFPKPPVQYEKGGYWSITAYGMDGYLKTENTVISAYEAEANPDGSYSVVVGNSEACKAAKNHIDMPEGGASITFRLYRPTNFEAAKAFENEFRKLNSGK